MLRLSLFAALGVMPGLCLQHPGEAQATFRVDVGLVNVLTTVKDARGGIVADLEKEDFTILAAGVPQQIAVFERQTDRPLSVMLLFDSSPSVTKERKFEQDAALRFVRNLLGRGANPADRVAVLSFSSYVNEVQGFTRTLQRLEKALLAIVPSPGTSVYDALYLAAEKLDDREGRRVIIIITDGEDTTSNISFAEAQEGCQKRDVVVYSIVVVPITADAGRNLGGENALRTLSAATGGLAFIQHRGDDLDAAFRRIERELRTQYLLAFYPRGLPPATGRFRRLEVQVGRPNLRVLSRTGYYAPAEEATGSILPSTVEIQARPPRERSKEQKTPAQPKRLARPARSAN